MKIFLDTADIDLIRSADNTGLIDGVTTNPSIIKKSGKNPVKVIRQIAEEFPELKSISAEVVSDTCEGMIEQAKEFSHYSNVTIKVPCTVEGLKACMELYYDYEMDVNVTLIFSVSQAILAAKAKAKYISPFVGRWCDQSIDGISIIRNIRKVYDNFGIYDTQILSASIRDITQVEKCAIEGTDIVTIPPVVFWSMYKNILTDKGLEQFNLDWASIK